MARWAAGVLRPRGRRQVPQADRSRYQPGAVQRDTASRLRNPPTPYNGVTTRLNPASQEPPAPMKIQLVRPLVARHYDHPLVRLLVRKLERTVKSAYHDGNWKHHRNGENWLIERFCDYWRARDTAPVAFDVGANVGAWAYTVLQREPGALMHCFEPVADTFLTLTTNLASCGGRIQANKFGLSDKKETMELWQNLAREDKEVFKDWTPLDIQSGEVWYDTVSKFPMPGAPERKFTVEMVRGDDYVKENKIKKVHVLKIDAEGMDYHVLRGMGDLVQQGQIDLIQYEWVNLAVLESPQFKDYLRLLAEQYQVGRLYPDRVKFRDWSGAWSDEAMEESKHDGNYVAVSRRCPDLVAHLQGARR